jgi:arylsulfatase
MNKSTRREFLIGAAASAPAICAGRNRQPNFLFLFPDQLRFDWISGYPGIPVRTPNLDRLAGRGVRFRKAVVASPLCAPSRACLASGKEYDRCGVASNGNNYPLSQTTYYSLLRDSGYHVMGCGKLDLHKATLDWGLDGKRLLPEWGFSDGIDNAGKFDAVRSGAKEPKDPYMAYLHRRGLATIHVKDFARRAKLGYQDTSVTPLPEEAYCDNWVADNGLELLKRAPRGKPWHLVVNFTGPHNPEDITKRMEKLCRDRRYPQPNRCLIYTPEIHVAIRQNYSAMVENIDRWVGTYLDELERRGELENTLVVFSSDHGEMLGDHNRWGKTLPYHASVSVPLIVAGPGVRHGVMSDALASIMDLAATYLDYADVPRPKEMDSRSLRPVLEGKTDTHRRHVLSGLGSWRMAWDGRYKLITGFDPESRKLTASPQAPPLLFDLENDPLENVNLASKEREQVSRLSRLLG